jgi:hypothetical protein
MKIAIIMLTLAGVARIGQADIAPLLIDDFAGGRSAIGSSWTPISDRVMGGRSDVSSSIEDVDGRRALKLSGTVRTANNGGFIQARLDLVRDRRPLDARAYTGIRLLVRGDGQGYFIHLRTSGTILPWQYYGVPLALSGAWQTIDVPFDSFRPEALGRKLDLERLTSVALVAEKSNFDALIFLGGMWLY